GTGNMKFSLNGALTIGTLDGANVEIREEVGPDNFYLFGLTAAQVQQLKADGYHPRAYYEQNMALREVLDFMVSGALSTSDASLFQPIVDNLLWHDPFMLLADYQAYVDCQRQVGDLWRDPQAWTRKSILNTARMGKFSADRSIREYCEHVWHVKPVVVSGKHKMPWALYTAFGSARALAGE
ncbi:MAG: glycogen/starch/alpha-glucan phosphorylase, partial [Burkholderiales bacterium]